ncbi:response regulator transcription factor [Lactococcus termiticola]|nr:response regulator transcription factor [Lactococcus termiticola]
MKKMLIADDDRGILTLLSFNFRQEKDFEVTTANDGQEALDMALKNPYDLILLDLMMPSYDGIEITKKLRKKGIYTPILILTAREDDQMKLKGLESGSDDYLDKTTPMKEIIARAKGLIRRHQQYDQQSGSDMPDEKTSKAQQDFGRLHINYDKKVIRLDEHRLDLTKREFEILEMLIDHEGEVISREGLIQHFWGVDTPTETRTIDVLVSKIRKKLDNQYIKTKRGFGYYFDPANS